ncbi:MAG TPA: hypothetical protein VML55_01465 [Planctomycetaceae bacterium]|nr:hypothetical protein [Planctomycetaceae bacterium]
MSALEKLAALVRQAEITAKANQLEGEIQTAARELRQAEAASQAAQQQLVEVREIRLAELEDADTRRQQLQELSRKAAQYRSYLQSTNEVEELITTSEKELEANVQTARADLEAAQAAAQQTLEALRAAMERYEKAREELEKLQPELAGEFAEEDRIFHDAAVHFPPGELRALEKEVRNCDRFYGALERNEQYAQMKIWIGRLRRLQTMELSEDEHFRARKLFPMLVGISKQYEPGYIEAFQQDFHTDWDRFIAEAKRELASATDSRRRRKELEQQQREQQQRDEESRRQAREAAQQDLDDLRRVIASFDLPEQGLDEFRTALGRVIAGFGISDEEVLRLVLPYRDVISEGPEFRALRRSLERFEQEQNGRAEPQGEDIADLLEFTRGQKALMIGGARREDVRQQLFELFKFERLEWEDYEGTKPAKLRSLEQRIRNGGLDLVLILKSFISHHVSEKLRPLCEQNETECLMVEHGYGAAQIAQALRKRKGMLSPQA